MKFKAKLVDVFERLVASKAISTINSECRYTFYKEKIPKSLEKYKNCDK